MDSIRKERDRLSELLLGPESYQDRAFWVGARQAAKNERERVLREQKLNAPGSIKTNIGKEDWAKDTPEYRDAESEEVHAIKQCELNKALWEAWKQSTVIASQHLAEQKERDRV